MTNKINFDALDVVQARIPQASGVISALLTTYTQQDTKGMQHILSPCSVIDVLSAVVELLDQAEEASRKIADDAASTASVVVQKAA